MTRLRVGVPVSTPRGQGCVLSIDNARSYVRAGGMKFDEPARVAVTLVEGGVAWFNLGRGVDVLFDACGRCGADAAANCGWHRELGWCCSKCGATDADE